MIPDDTPGSGPGFLVLLNDPFVAEDVARSISEHDPTAQVVCAQTPEAALLLVQSEGRIGVALLQMAPSEVARSALGQLLSASGTRIALAGDAAEQQGSACAYEVLQRPFSSAEIIRVLSRARAS
ncbi:hypothetical protein [Alloyangia pacifica]|uniref:Response regulatory domain-containing protein n=1 Tax=Alloyangia pacifica TaxID=311180 RepID=A0A1I6S8B0_9RHOB|nr:hypothetical protein [Alloyangia pacifica]SDG72945.1 hypothetical protein SAMN04488245_104185 [Alloyangia pacifica]SFS73133.1 hypothetical protein SAMN04488050_104185 [Alloyangia pacifica]